MKILWNKKNRDMLKMTNETTSITWEALTQKFSKKLTLLLTRRGNGSLTLKNWRKLMIQLTKLTEEIVGKGEIVLVIPKSQKEGKTLSSLSSILMEKNSNNNQGIRDRQNLIQLMQKIKRRRKEISDTLATNWSIWRRKGGQEMNGWFFD